MQPVDGRKERWRSHRAARREEFVDAALRALAAHGPELRVARVAAAAGVSKPVLYRHFADKDDLLAALHVRLTAMLMERLAPATDPAAAPTARIRGAIDALFSLLDEHPNLYRLVSRTLLTGPDSGRQGVRSGKTLAARTLTQVFDAYLFAFGLGTRGAEPMAHAVVGMVHNTAEWWLEHGAAGRAETVDRLAEAVWDCFDGFLRRRGVTVDPGTPLPPEDALAARAGSTYAAGPAAAPASPAAGPVTAPAAAPHP
ncbi:MULTISPECIES: TetR/AcrR family transcriptional regulator [Streptomyces]|uniref:TetR/AcrR family transcriptional regulator n=1 Tax=Streptomyces TaxID=1883 RepID=UPI002248B62B|nr:TetR/AcrR family transcriptional regulator [Streptomyces sp. JHD 1]MCX2968392.1 TetR/AcrR family transcriptional regulator [Streptomyces sp. JHD 1]